MPPFPAQKLPLHARIEEWGHKNPKKKELSELLLATKRIGYAESHKTDLNQNDLIKAYKFIEHVFSEVYENRTESIRMMAKRVNKIKVPTK